MTMRTFINIAMSLVLALALLFIVRGMAGMIFHVAPPQQTAAAKPAAPAEKAAEAKPEPESKPAENKPRETAAAKPAEEKPAEQPAAGAASAEAGAKVFKKCKACHYADKEKNKVGPYLKGVVGRKAASIEGFKYSDAMKAKGAEGLTWTEENLAEYLARPKGFVPGNRMAFAGLKKPEDIASVIAYLKSLR